MTEEDWKKSYQQVELPHWVENLTPSLLAEQLLRSLPTPKGNKILEIGVGNGRDSIFFAQAGNEVMGIDIASGAITLAIENSKKAGVEPKIRFAVGDAEHLEFPDGTFDAVYSISVLHSTWLPASMAEISRVLKPGGKVMLYLYEMTKSGGIKYWFYKKEKVEEIARESGLIVETSRSAWDRRHEEETTKILIMRMRKGKR